MSEVYPGDIFRLSMSAWTGDTAEYRDHVIVLCARWNDGTLQGPTSCTNDLTANNRIKVDREMPFDMTGSSLADGPISGHTLTQVERIGGGTVDKDNLPMHFGIEDLTISHLKPAGIKGSFGMVEAPGCFECWLYNVHADTGWGNSWVDLGASALSSTSRFLVLSSVFEGELWKNRCVLDVTAVSTDTPMEVTMTTNGSCNSFCSGTNDSGLWFPYDFEATNLAGRFATCSCSASGTTECVDDGQVRVAVYDGATGSAIVGTGQSVSGGDDWAVQLNNWNIGGIGFSGNLSDSQVINVAFHNARVSYLQQDGAYKPVVFGTYSKSDAGSPSSRCLFNHGGPGSATLWERNDCDSGFVWYAGSMQGHGYGPFGTMLFNRGRERVTFGGSFQEQCPNGGLCDERTNLQGYAIQYSNFLGNSLTWINSGGYSATSGYQLDRCENDKSGTSNCTINGPQDPFMMRDTLWERNLVYGESLGSDDFDSNSTTSKSDYADGSDADDAVEAGWDSTVWPTSLAYDREIEADSEFIPDWWCQEACRFDTPIGAPSDDYNGGSPTYCKLPAQILLEGGTCTPPDTDDDDSDGVVNQDDNCKSVANAGQRDDDEDGYGNICDWDVSQDCTTGAPDSSTTFARTFDAAPWSPKNRGAYDINEDGAVGAPDLNAISNHSYSLPGPSGRLCADCTAAPTTGLGQGTCPEDP